MRQAFVGILSLLVFTMSSVSSAQEFRIYTKVWDLNAGSDPVARSLSIWHAGKVYDVLESAGEVTIFEPAQRRISIVNSNKMLLTSVDFDELKHFLRETEDRLAEQAQKNSPSKELVDWLQFQLHPQFAVSLDPQKNRLSLESRPLSYEVKGESKIPPQVIESYANYADWTCRLNYLLHPQPVFPNVRLELNQQLRKAKLFPVEVQLRARLDQPLNLKAVHKLEWNLDSRDRQKIHQWESQLRDSKLKTVTLMEYQRALLTQQTAKIR